MRIIGERIRAFVELNNDKLEIKKITFYEERVVVKRLNLIPHLRIPRDIQIIHNHGDILIVAECGEKAPLYSQMDFSDEMAAFLKAQKEDDAF